MNKLLGILVLLLPFFGMAQKDTVAHLYVFGGNNNDNAEEIEATTDGGYIVIGSTSSSSAGNTDAYLLKIDSLCNREWSKALGGNNNDWGYSIKQTFDKGFIIATSSNSYGNGGYDAVLMKRDSLGNYVWRKVYGGQDWDFAYSVVQTYDSGYVFCGETYNNSNGFSDVYIVKTNPLGDTLWTRTYGGALIDKGNAVIETSDSNIVVAGIKNTTTDSTDVYVIKLTPNGTLLWDSIYGDTLYENANTIMETVNGDYVIGGATNSYSPAGDTDFYVIRTDKNGVVGWTNYFGNPSLPKDQEIFDVYEDGNGDIINVGFTEEAGGGMKDAYLFYIAGGGWWIGKASTFGGPNNEVSKSITIGNDGSMKMAGYSNSYGNGLDDALVISVDTIVPAQQFTIDTITDLAPLRIEQHSPKSDLRTYPNPATTSVNFKSSQEIDGVQIIDLYGRVVKAVSISDTETLDVRGLQNGLYTVQFYNENQLIGTKKVIINK